MAVSASPVVKATVRPRLRRSSASSTRSSAPVKSEKPSTQIRWEAAQSVSTSRSARTASLSAGSAAPWAVTAR